MKINDGSDQPPRLLVYAHSWALQELPRLPHERAWTWTESLERVVEAGYDGLQAEPERADDILSRGLRFAAGGRANTPAEVKTFLQRCADLGAECVTLHLGWGHENDAAATHLVQAMLEDSDRLHLPAYIETHRATVVQDLWRALALIERIPEIRFNADYSHYYCAHEVPYLSFETFLDALQPVLARTCFFHGRVSNGQVMQASVADAANAVHLDRFKMLWQQAMHAWLKQAGPGDILPFVPELGPPSSDYSITIPQDEGRAEITDRWQEMLLLRDIAREVFRKVLASREAAGRADRAGQ